MDGDRILASYLVETPYPVEHAVEVVAGEQSSGTFTRVPGETEELQERFRARVERIHELETVETPSLSGVQPDDLEQPVRYHRAEVTVSWSLENMGTYAAQPAVDGAGNLYELSEFSGLKLLDLDLPPAFADAYPGPQFGVAGTRNSPASRPAADRHDHQAQRRPDPEQTAELVRDLVEAGHRLHQGRRADGQPAALAVRERRGGGDARDQRSRRPDRQEGDVRLQHHRRDRRDAAAPRAVCVPAARA